MDLQSIASRIGLPITNKTEAVAAQARILAGWNATTPKDDAGVRSTLRKMAGAVAEAHSGAPSQLPAPSSGGGKVDALFASLASQETDSQDSQEGADAS